MLQFSVNTTPVKPIRMFTAARGEVAERRRIAAYSAIPALIVVWFAVSVHAQRDDRARTEALAARASQRLQALHREADQLAAQERTLLGELRKLELERQIKIEELRQLDAEAAQLERDLSESSSQLTALEAEVVAARPDLEARLVEIYKLGRARYARLLLSAPDVRGLGRAARTAAVLAKLDRERVDTHQRTLKELASTRATLEERRRRLADLRTEARRAEADVARTALARSDAIRGIDRQRDLNAQLAGELQAAQQKLQAALGTMSTMSTTSPMSTAPVGGGTAAAMPASLPFKAFRSDLDWPTAGTVRRRFSAPVAGRPPTSNGIEIEASEGAVVSAVHGGLVAFADTFAGFGNLVILDHGAQAFTLYGNLLEIGVKSGAIVEAGQPLGTVGATLTGPAGLYFEMRVDGQPVDPLQWLKSK